MNKNLNIVTNLLDLTGGILLVSSFFVKDNDKAVKRRWYAVGAFASAIGVRVINHKAGIAK